MNSSAAEVAAGAGLIEEQFDDAVQQREAATLGMWVFLATEILFFGVLYHLRYPLLAIDQLRRVSRGTIYSETLVIDQRFLAEGKDFQPLSSYHSALTQVPLWQFYKSNELSDDYSNWFGPNIQAVLGAFESAGFNASLISEWGDRAAFQAVTGGADTMGQSYEGVSEVVRNDLALGN